MGTLKILTPATLINILTLVSAFTLALFFNRTSHVTGWPLQAALWRAVSPIYKWTQTVDIFRMSHWGFPLINDLHPPPQKKLREQFFLAFWWEIQSLILCLTKLQFQKFYNKNSNSQCFLTDKWQFTFLGAEISRYNLMKVLTSPILHKGRLLF